MNRARLGGMASLALLIAMASLPGCTQSSSSEASTPEEWTEATDINDVDPDDSSSSEAFTPEGWTEATHSNDVDPDYETVFPQDDVNRIEITIAPDDWEAMQANAEELLGSSGGEPGDAGPGAARPRPDGGRLPPRDMAQDGGDAPVAPGIPGFVDATSDNPMWVPATVEFNGITWTDVGVRYKGNSSLRSGWSSGSTKLPLKLDFDEFEDDNPAIEDQRFYGFKQLSLSNAFADATYVRDALTSDILAEAGLPVAETAFYEVIIDYGEGPVDLGLYVAIEVIDDTAIDRYFDDDSGNIYEGDGPGVSLAENTYDWITTSFQKENNEEEADWGDIENLYDVLHSEERLSDPDAWRDNLEAVFNVDGFLEWLAIGSVLEHWDRYGQMSHNFYVYDDPETGQLNWISWDHNEVLQGSDGSRGDSRRTVSLDRSEVGTDWPLIRYLLDDHEYMDRYVGYLEESIVGSCDPESLEERCLEMAELIRPYVTEESNEDYFDTAVQQLIDRCYARYDEAFTFLAAMEGD